MKKILTLLAIFTVLMGSVFAETVGDNPDDPFERERFENEKLSTKIINMDLTNIGLSENERDKNAAVKIEYRPMHDDLYIYYETLYITYDEGEAMNAVKACLEKFQKDEKYYSYRYMGAQKTKHYKDDRGQRKTVYSAHVKLAR